MYEPMKSNGCLGDRENQLVSTYRVDIKVQAGGMENLQKGAQNAGCPLASLRLISGRGFRNGYGP